MYDNKCLGVFLAERNAMSLLDSGTLKEEVDEVFAFDRTVSRLLEMQSKDYFLECSNRLTLPNNDAKSMWDFYYLSNEEKQGREEGLSKECLLVCLGDIYFSHCQQQVNESEEATIKLKNFVETHIEEGPILFTVKALTNCEFILFDLN